MFHHFTFATPFCLQDDNLSEVSFGEGRQPYETSTNLKNTNSSSKTNRKFIKVLTSQSRKNSIHQSKIAIGDPYSNQQQRKDKKNGCLCLEGFKTQEIVDFGFTSRVRKISPDNKKQLNKVYTPMEKLQQLQHISQIGSKTIQLKYKK